MTVVPDAIDLGAPDDLRYGDLRRIIEEILAETDPDMSAHQRRWIAWLFLYFCWWEVLAFGEGSREVLAIRELRAGLLRRRVGRVPVRAYDVLRPVLARTVVSSPRYSDPFGLPRTTLSW